jgi:hypothetical protein
MKRIVLAIAVAVALVVLASAGAADPVAGAKKKDAKPVRCAATKLVVNGGKPPKWAVNLYSVLKKPANGDVLETFKRSVCNDPFGNRFGLDLHRSWKVPDPGTPRKAWFRIIPGKTGLALLVGGWSFQSAYRCVLESRLIQPLSWSGFFIYGPAMFTGMATDDVASITATGGKGTRLDEDGNPLPVTVTVTPHNNVYRLVAPNGAGTLTFNHKDGSDPLVVNLGGPQPIEPKCIGQGPKLPPAPSTRSWLGAPTTLGRTTP